MTTKESIQNEIAAAQKKLNACRDFGERRRLVGYIQGLKTALSVLQDDAVQELPY